MRGIHASQGSYHSCRENRRFVGSKGQKEHLRSRSDQWSLQMRQRPPLPAILPTVQRSFMRAHVGGGRLERRVSGRSQRHHRHPRRSVGEHDFTSSEITHSRLSETVQCAQKPPFIYKALGEKCDKKRGGRRPERLPIGRFVPAVGEVRDFPVPTQTDVGQSQQLTGAYAIPGLHLVNFCFVTCCSTVG